MIEFRAFGAVALTRPDGSEVRAVLERPKLLGLLAFLAASTPHGFHRRDTLLALFWPDVDQERARRALRQSLYHLRQSLGEGTLIGRGEEEVALSGEEFWSDVVAFDEALERGEREAALGLYRGDLLQGFFVSDAQEFDRWLEQRRAELRERAARAAWELAETGLHDRNPTVAAHWGRRAVHFSPFDERLLRRTIKLLDRVGDRAGAVREYDAFARRLEQELDLPPSPETRALIDEVRSRSQTPPDRVTASPPPAMPRAAPDSADPGPGPGSVSANRLADPAVTVDVDRLRQALADRYAIERQIGAGGMASVYLARDVRHDREVAVKVMHPELAATLGADRFLREIKIVASLTHPHIVPLFDSGFAGGFLYYVMPHIAGESLRARLDREGQLPLTDAIAVACEVADALGYAHSLDVIHRDIKPANILLSGGHALVADFGVARAVSAASDIELTVSGMPVGTPTYMSPEQASGSAEIDGRSDTYSLGCVLYEMLAGEPPFIAPTREQLVGQHVLTPPRHLSALRPVVPEAVAAAVDRALQKAPADRFASAPELAAALVAASSGRSPWRRWRPGKKHVVLAAAAVVVLGASVALLKMGQAPALAPDRVVVAPFENRTGDPALAVLGTMAAERITQGLEDVDVVEVVSSRTNLEPAAQPSDRGERSIADAALALARAEGAGTVVVGALYRSGELLEFQTQIVDAGTGRLLRAVESVAGPLDAPGDVVDALRRRVVGVLARMRDPLLASLNPDGEPPSPEAYREYLEGHRRFYQPSPAGYPLGQRDALRYLYRAVELDSSFLDPRFLIVWAHWNLGEPEAADSNARLLIPHRPRLSAYERHILDWSLALLRGDRTGALEAARAMGAPINVGVEAVRSNRLYEAIDALGVRARLVGQYFAWLSYLDALHMVGDYRGELKEAGRARREYPERMRVLIAEVRALAALGRIEELGRRLDEGLLLPAEEGVYAGGAMMTAAAELRHHGFGEAALAAGERAIAWFDSRPAQEHATPYFRSSLAEAYYLVERWDDARGLFEALAEESPRDVNYQGFLGVLAARRGEREEALRISERLRGMNRRYDFGRDLYWQACIAAQLGELEQAMALLREAYARGRLFAPGLHRDMDLEPLRDYRPFQEFMAPKG